jgi:LTXXQ motif family protein
MACRVERAAVSARILVEDPASRSPIEPAFRAGACPENPVNKRLLVFATLVALPSVAASQRTRSQADKRTELFDRDSSRQTQTLRVRDVEDQSPIKLLIDKRKDLKLTDAQLSQLKDTESKLKDKNAPLLKAVDSLVRDMRSAASSQSDEARSRARNARMGLMTTLGDVRANYDASAKDAVAALDPDQQSKAAELLEKQKQEMERFFQERLGGGRGERH